MLTESKAKDVNSQSQELFSDRIAQFSNNCQLNRLTRDFRSMRLRIYTKQFNRGRASLIIESPCVLSSNESTSPPTRTPSRALWI